MDYIGLQENYFLVWTSAAATLTYWVQQSVISVYSNRFFDLSNLSFFNYGDKFTTYQVESPPTANILEQKPERYLTVMVLQGPQQT